MKARVFLSTADFARIAAVSPEAVRKWVQSGTLPVAARHESGIRFYRRADAARVIRARHRAALHPLTTTSSRSRARAAARVGES